MAATNKIVKSAHDNRVLISIWLAVAGFIALQLLSTRDQSLTQPFIDAAQDESIKILKGDISEIKTDVKSLLFHASNKKESSDG